MLDSIVKIVLSWVSSKGQEQKQASSGPSKWGVWLVVSCLVVIFLGILYAYLWFKGRKLAKLEHEKDLADEAKRKAEESIKLGALDKEIESKKVEIKEHEANIVFIDAKIEKINKDRDNLNETIQKLRNWDDLDKLMSGGGSS